MEGPEEHAAPPAPAEAAPSRRERLRHHTRYASTALLAAALVILIALIVDNTHQVKINWVFGDSRAALVWIVVVAGIVGWVAGLATSALLRRRRRRRA